jgi:hypothetical protein
MYEMKDIITWLENNKEWVFSGIGVAALGLFGMIFKPRSTAKALTQLPSVAQSPSVSQAPVVNITTNVDAGSKPPEPTATPEATNPTKANQAPFFALNPLAVARDLVIVTGASNDEAVEVCVARFKMHDGMTDWIPIRFEASIDYVERLSASGFPYEHRAGHINQARWLTSSNDVHELILIAKRYSIPYAVTAVDDEESFRCGDGSLVQLDLVSSCLFATVTLIDITSGQKWEAEYEIAFNPGGALAVRQTGNLHRG